ncbi:hypothetical protein VNO78_05536 [Psophocarpus tetragonolobus]|uniref:Secreted protein n=1 Tax=Psophocarpus tetragonolobus TaxID=3891 RepID=A0AAN9SZR9_PSOTE
MLFSFFLCSLVLCVLYTWACFNCITVCACNVLCCCYLTRCALFARTGVKFYSPPLFLECEILGNLSATVI